MGGPRTTAADSEPARAAADAAADADAAAEVRREVHADHGEPDRANGASQNGHGPVRRGSSYVTNYGAM